MDEAKIEPELPVSRINTILKNVIELLWFEPQGLFIHDILGYLKDTIIFNDFEKSAYPEIPYMPRYEVIVRLGTMPFEKAGWLEKTTHGRWFLTNEGRKACRLFKDSSKFFETSVDLLQQWTEREQKRKSIISYDPFQEAQEHSWEQIKRYFEVLEYKDYRIIVKSLFKALGFNIVSEISTSENTDNVDLIYGRDLLGLQKPRAVVHIAKPGTVTTIEEIQLFAQDLWQEDVGVYISFPGFADGVNRFIAGTKNPVIRTIDLTTFITLWSDNCDKIDPQGFIKFPVRNVPFLSIPDRNI